MIVVLALISFLLSSNVAFSMRPGYVSINMVSDDYIIPISDDDTCEYTSEITDTMHYITSLDEWERLIEKNVSPDEYEVSPQAMAEYQHTYEITSNHPMLPEAMQAWSDIKNSKKSIADYNQEVLQVDQLLRNYKKDIWKHIGLLAGAKDFFIKQNYEQLNQIEESITAMHSSADRFRLCALSLPLLVTATVLLFVFELTSLILK